MTGLPHPDLDALSAALDGEDDAAAAHAADCPVCAEQLARLRSVSELVAADPAPLPAMAIDRLVTNAVRTSTVTPFDEARRRGPRRPPVGWIAAAAAAIAAVAAVPALLGGVNAGNDDFARGGEENGAVESLDSGSAELSDGTAAADAQSAGPPSFTGGDLGDQSDPDELVRVVAAMSAMGGDAEVAAAEGTQGASGAGGGSRSSPATTAPAPRVAAAPVPTECEAVTREVGAGRLGRLFYAASARWRGEPAEVLAFELEPGPGVKQGERQLYVLRRGGCSVLAERRF